MKLLLDFLKEDSVYSTLRAGFIFIIIFAGFNIIWNTIHATNIDWFGLTTFTGLALLGKVGQKYIENNGQGNNTTNSTSSPETKE